MLLRQTSITWNQFNPFGTWLVVKEDPEQTETKGGIILTEVRPMAADLGFFTGTVLKQGKDVKDTCGFDLVGERICHRKFLADVIKFSTKHEDGSTVFVMKLDDVEAMVGEGTKIDAI